MTPQHSSDGGCHRAPQALVHQLRALLSWGGMMGLLCLVGGGFTPARAWNDFGHMTVAAVAWQHLTPAARAEASALLRLNPDYPHWVSAVAPEQRDVVAFLKASTWADAIRHESGYVNDGERPDGPDANLNSGYEDPREHRYWHFVDVPFSPDGTPLPAVPTPNAVTRIADFRQVLADRSAPAALKSYDLAWVLHLVGDLHQPLHAVSRFTHALPEGDRGGNRVRLCAPPCRRELHDFWDQALGRGTPAQALALASRLPAPTRRQITDTHIADWLQESRRIARGVVYGPPIGPDAGPYTLTEAYREQARSVARQRAVIAGRRLAVLLNRALRRDEPASPQ